MKGVGIMMIALCVFLLIVVFTMRPKRAAEIMTIICISLLLLTFAGCSHSNSGLARRWPTFHYNGSALTTPYYDRYLAELNNEQNSAPFKNGGLNYSYRLLNWWAASSHSCKASCFLDPGTKFRRLNLLCLPQGDKMMKESVGYLTLAESNISLPGLATFWRQFFLGRARWLKTDILLFLFVDHRLHSDG